MPDHTTFAGADPAAAQAYQAALDDVLRVTATTDAVRSHMDRCPTFVHGQLLLVLLALADDDLDGADERLRGLSARRIDLSRRHRQLCEIVGLAVRSERYRFQTLAVEHLAEHPDDRGLLVAAEIALAHAPRPTP